MDLICIERPSDSPYVERIWRSESEGRAAPFISVADNHWEMVVTCIQSRSFLTVRGPETRATPAYSPAEATFFGIQFKPGVYMPKLPPRKVMDRRDLDLPEATGRSFWLDGATWQIPDFENAEAFVDRLVREDLLVYDPVVAAAMQAKPVEASLRTVQRRFLQATGLTQASARQIERARCAVYLLKRGHSIVDVTYQAGYFDQPHLTHALKQFIGLTPAQVADKSRTERLSFLYKTDPDDRDMIGISNALSKEHGHAESQRIGAF